MGRVSLDAAPSKSKQQPSTGRSSEATAEIVSQVQESSRRNMSLAIIGHVDTGKSTLVGSLMHRLGISDDRQVAQRERDAAITGMKSFAYAWNTDTLEGERERGVTMDIALQCFETEKYTFTLIDTPGHQDYVPNMIAGAAQADAGILLVDGTDDPEEILKPKGQTREHAVVVRSLGLQQVIVAVNKMELIDWESSRYDAVVSHLDTFLRHIGFDKISFVPIAAITGINITRAAMSPGYTGRTVVELLDALEKPQREYSKPLRIPVVNVFKGASAVHATGRIESGVLRVGERVSVFPGDTKVPVRELLVNERPVACAGMGDIVDVALSQTEESLVPQGAVLCMDDAPVPIVSRFTARIVVFELDYPITVGSAFELYSNGRDYPVAVVGLGEASSRKGTSQRPRFVTSHSHAVLTLEHRPYAGDRSAGVPLEAFSFIKGMGRVLLRRSGDTVAAGVVESVSRE